MDSEINQGIVISIRGSVIDTRFPAGKVPSIRNILKTGENGHIRIEVLTQLDDEIARGISLNPTQGLARGTIAIDTGAPSQVPVGKDLLGRVFNVFGDTIDDGPPLEGQVYRPLQSSPVPIMQQSTISEILRQGSRRSISSVPWNGAGRRGCLAGREWARRSS